MTKNHTELHLHASTPADEAQALTDALRKKLEHAVFHTATAQGLLNDVADLAKRAFDREAWKTLGYSDWETYCQRELFKMGYIKWTPEQRLELIENLRNAGLSFRTIASVAGCNPSTVYRNWSGVAGATPHLNDELGKQRSRGLDGKSHPAGRPMQGRKKPTGATFTGQQPQPQGSVSSLDEKVEIPDADKLYAENVFKTRFGDAVGVLVSHTNTQPLNEAIRTLAKSLEDAHFQPNRSELERRCLTRIQGQIKVRQSEIEALQRVADALRCAEQSSPGA